MALSSMLHWSQPSKLRMQDSAFIQKRMMIRRGFTEYGQVLKPFTSFLNGEREREREREIKTNKIL